MIPELKRSYISSPPQGCLFNGNSDMYGVGIRVGFYLQWYGVLLAAWIAPEEVYNMRITTTFFTAATFLATVILTVRQLLDPVEIYVVLLLNFGSALYLIPVFTWRITTGFNPRLDPTRFPRAQPPSATFNVLHFLLLIVVSCYQVWFWASQRSFVDVVDHCPRYAFFFSKEVQLSTPWFRMLNLVLPSVLLVMLVALLAMLFIRGDIKGKYDDDDWNNREYRTRLHFFQAIDSVLRFSVSTVMLIATESTIIRNRIEGVNSAVSAGQLIPLVIGLAAIVRVLYLAIKSKSMYGEFPRKQNWGPSSQTAMPVTGGCGRRD